MAKSDVESEPKAAPELGRSSPSVLLLGEANFSFALALVKLLEPPASLLPAPPPKPGKSESFKAKKKREAAEAKAAAAEADPEKAQQPDPLTVASAYLGLGFDECRSAKIVATCYEGEKELLEKYPEVVGILSQLNAHASKIEVRFGVDALDLRSSFGDGKHWDVIAWNHPHLGTEDFRLHRFLLAHFFASAAGMLRDHGCISLSLVEGQETRWGLIEQASRQSLSLRKTPSDFAAKDFPGYECKRNTTGKSFKNLHSQRNVFAAMKSWNYHLALEKFLEDRVETLSLPKSTEKKKNKSRAGSDADPTSSRAVGEFTCETCGKSYSCAQGLKTHRRQVHELKKYGETSEQELCTVCGRKFRDKEALWQHEKAAHSEAEKQAAESGSTSKGRGARGPSLLPGAPGLNDAEQEERIKSSRYGYETCKICGMAIPRGTSMAAHLEALKPLVSLSLRCACGKNFVEQRALEQHSRFCSEAAAAASAAEAAKASKPICLQWIGSLCQAYCTWSPSSLAGLAGGSKR
eukprot:TRINITY_DN111854_c0_g1_i1.p1 TRINITY_DN111854_c0_g1~~TRINITY_DN111854_c0_g1_i1.p1  ORF type:complete len:521 (+),score=111.28 TRINITY_DN111854_c0_g1_i1:51-1613(+)